MVTIDLVLQIAANVIALDAPVEPLQLVEELAQAFGLTSGSSGTLAQGRLRVAPQTEIGMTAEFPDSNSPYGALGIYRSVSRDVVEESTDARGGVVDLVDVCAELAVSGCHPVAGGTSLDPHVGSWGVHQQLLDLR